MTTHELDLLSLVVVVVLMAVAVCVRVRVRVLCSMFGISCESVETVKVNVHKQ